MKLLSCFLLACACAGFALVETLAQSPADNNAGSRLEVDTANGILRFKWWAKANSTYFIQHSEDLQSWNWVPVVEPGDDSIKEYGFTTTSTRFFVRLKITPTIPGESAEIDSDGDGIPDLLEVQQGSDPLNFYDRPNGLIIPQIQILSGNGQTGLPSKSLKSRLTVKVIDSVTGQPVANAPVLFTPSSGRVSRSQVRAGSSGRVGVTFTTPESPGSSTILAAAGATSVLFTATTVESAELLPPNAPSGFTTTYNADGSRTLSWRDNSDNEDVFVIWAKNENDAWVEIGTVPANQTTATITPEGTLAP